LLGQQICRLLRSLYPSNLKIITLSTLKVKKFNVFFFINFRSRADFIDFSVPYFHSGVSLLAAPQSKSEIPLLAFLLPFSPELWIAIFTSLNITAVAVAVYEWLSPFGLNPWGRQRSKNFSMSSGEFNQKKIV
jgi:ABC-type amino acid transport substrate-binding protein